MHYHQKGIVCATAITASPYQGGKRMKLVTMEIEISRTKLRKSEFTPDRTERSKAIPLGDDINDFWKSAGELLVHCFALDKNS